MIQTCYKKLSKNSEREGEGMNDGENSRSFPVVRCL